MDASGSLDRAIAKLGRRFDFMAVGLLVVVVAVITPLWIRDPPPFTLYAFGNLTLFFVLPILFFLAGRLAPRSIRKGLAGIRPRIRDVGLAWIPGLVFVLDDGLFVQSASAMYLTAFFRSSGNRIVPLARDAIRWSRPFGWKRQVHVRSWGHQAEDELSRMRLGYRGIRCPCDRLLQVHAGR